MPTIKISEENKTRLDTLLAQTIGANNNPSVTMDNIITFLLDVKEQFLKGPIKARSEVKA
jgi:hypothetical protein